MREIFKYSFIPFVLVLAMYIVKTIEYVIDADFHKFGIFPKLFIGLKGIMFAPFVHVSFTHLYSNTIPFFLLFTAILYFYRNIAFKVIFIMWMLTGIGVWLGGRPYWHIGASGLIYAFASFLFFAGLLNKNRNLIAVSLLVSFLYGGIVWGIFPQKERISWESHFFGFLSGIIMSYFAYKQEYVVQEKRQEISSDFVNYNISVKIKFKYHFSDSDD